MKAVRFGELFDGAVCSILETLHQACARYVVQARQNVFEDGFGHRKFQSILKVEVSTNALSRQNDDAFARAAA
jgi:hypothetical protein